MLREDNERLEGESETGKSSSGNMEKANLIRKL